MLFKPALIFAFILLSAIAGTQAGDTHLLYVPVPNAPAGRPAPAFSEGVLAGDTFYIAGHIGFDPATHRAPSDPEVEARIAMDSIQQTLKGAGLTWDDVVSLTVYCTDMSLYDHFNAVYRTYFHGHYPARALVGVKDLLFAGHFEISGVAKVPSHAP
jgi:2-iminobutanoate/2-iminopropanoate deaminase